MKNKTILYFRTSFTVLILFLLGFVQVQAQSEEPTIVINEIYNGDLDNDNAFIELLVTGNKFSPCNIHVPHEVSLIIDDTNQGEKMQPGHIAIKSECIRDAKMGDLILIYGKNTVVPESRARFRFRIDDSCVEKWANYPNRSDSTYHNAIPVIRRDAMLKDFLSFSEQSQEIQIRTKDSTIHEVKLTGQQQYALTYGDYKVYDEIVNTPMEANNTQNGLFQNGIIIAGQQFTITTKVFDDGNNPKPIKNDVEINICNGTPPFHIETTNYDQAGITTRKVVIHDLPCGVHTVKVTDAEGEVRTRNVSVSPSECLFLSACVGDELTLPLLECVNLVDTCYAWFPEDLFAGQPDGNKTLQPTLTMPSTPGELELELFVSNSNGNISGVFKVFIDVSIDNDGDGLCGSDDPDDDNVCIPLGYVPVSIVNLNGEDPSIKCSSEPKDLTADLGDSWEWNTGETTQTITVDSEGAYSVTVTDNDGCTGETLIQVFEYEAPEVSLPSEVILCQGFDEVQLNVGISDLYTYQWSSGQTGKTITVVDPGVYTVTVSNQGVCEVILSTTVVLSSTNDCCEETPNFSIDYDGSLEVCEGGSTLITITLEGGTPPYDLYYSNQVISETEIGLGVYELEILAGNQVDIFGFDNYGCYSEDGFMTLEIVELDSPDSDGDGVCDVLDPDPNDPCNPFIDSDGDGVCDAVDCYPNDPFRAPGLSCWDNNTCTTDDKYDEDCNCVGTPIPDCNCEIGDPCDDSNPCTENDVIYAEQWCGCVGTPIPFCENCIEGTPCDDNNDCTIDDTFDLNCDCVGTDISVNGTPCDDGNECTIDDQYVDCECIGTTLDPSVPTPCDDGNDCTINDTYVGCECVGESIVQFNITSDLPPCENGSGTLTVVETYSEYEWRFDGTTVSNTNECQVIFPGTYDVIVVNDDGCFLKEKYVVVDFENSNLTIEASATVICNSLNPVELSVDASWTGPKRWINPQGNMIGQGFVQNIFLPGTYRFETTDQNGCERFGEILIEQAFDPEVEIVLTDPQICAEEFTLEIAEQAFDATVTWTGPGVFTNPEPHILLATTPGTYSVSVTNIGKFGECNAYDEYKVINGLDNQDIEEFLLENGFTMLNISSAIVTLRPEDAPATRDISSCSSFLCLSDKDYTDVEFDELPGVTIDDLDDHIEEILCDVDQCDVLNHGILVNSLCGNSSTDLDYFMNYGEGEETIEQVYVMHDEVTDEPVKMFFKHSTASGCDPFMQQPDLFEDFFFDLACALNKSENSLVLTQNPKFKNFTSGKIKLFDSNTYEGLKSTTVYESQRADYDDQFYTYNSLRGFGVFNYRPGRELNLSGINEIPTNTDYWKSNHSYVFKSCGTTELFLENIAALEIPYYDCGAPLIIAFKADELDRFQRILEDPDLIVSERINANDPYLWQSIPPCLDIDHCLILKNAIPEGCGSNTTDDNYFEVIEHLMRHWENTDGIIKCIKDNNLIYHYDCNPNLKRDRDFYKLVLQKHFASSYFANAFEPTGDIVLDGEQFLFAFGDKFTNTFRKKYVSTVHQDVGLGGYTYIGDKDFNYFNNYGLRIDNEFNFINEIFDLPNPSNGKKEQLKDFKVPGLYVPYATAEWKKGENQEDIELLVDVASIALAFTGLPSAAVFARMSRLRQAIVVLDITKEVGGFLLEQGVCKCEFGKLNLSPEDQAKADVFCTAWQIISAVSDVALLADGVKNGIKERKALKEAFEDLPDVAKDKFDEVVSTKITENGGGVEDIESAKRIYRGVTSIAEIIDIFKVRYSSLWNHPLYKDMFQAGANPQGAIYRLAKAHFEGSIDVKRLLDPALSKHIQGTSNAEYAIAKEFFERARYTINNTSPGLAHKMDFLTEDGFDIWKEIKHRPQLSKDMNVVLSIEKVSKNPGLVSFLKSKYGGNGYMPFFEKLTNPPISRGHALNSTQRKPWVNIILDNLDGFSTKYLGKPGFGKVVEDLVIQPSKTIGANWVMKYSNSKNWNNVSFEVKAEQGNFIVDIVADGVYHELKSWGSNYMTSSGFKNQFFNYVNEPQFINIDKVEYNFHPNSGVYPRWPEDMDGLKTAFQDFLTNNEGSFDLNDVDKVARYKQFFKFSANDMTEIGTDVSVLIQKIVNEKFSKIFI